MLKMGPIVDFGHVKLMTMHVGKTQSSEWIFGEYALLLSHILVRYTFAAIASNLEQSGHV